MPRMRIFWSVYLILLGLLLFVKLLLNLKFDVASAALSLLLLQSGLFLVTGGFGLCKKRYAQGGGHFLFYNGSIALGAETPDVVLFFGNADIDLLPPLNRLSTVICIFGNASIRIPENCSVRSVCTAAFGNISSPNGEINGFGNRILIVGDGIQTQLEVQCCFGQVTLLD